MKTLLLLVTIATLAGCGDPNYQASVQGVVPHYGITIPRMENTTSATVTPRFENMTTH